MATLDKVRLLDPTAEAEQARAMAARYRCEYVDLREAAIDHDLFRSIPVDLMFRYNFVPMQLNNGTLDIALSDPRNLNLIDELTLLLNRKLRIKVATLSQIAEMLRRPSNRSACWKKSPKASRWNASWKTATAMKCCPSTS